MSEPLNHQHDNPEPEGLTPETMAEISAALEAAMRRAQVIDPQVRMFLRACADAGLALTSEHLHLDEATGSASISIDWRTFLHLTRQFEDVAAAQVELASAPPSGPALFHYDPPTGPVYPRPAGNGLHIEVPA